MSKFLSHVIVPPAPAVLSAWHPSDPLLALATADGRVLVYKEEGEQAESEESHRGS